MVTAGMTTAQVIAELTVDLGLTPDEMAATLAVSAGQLDRWRDHGTPPSDRAAVRLRHLAALGNRLQETFLAEDVASWLRTKNRYLHGETPIAALAQGRLDDVEGAIEIVESGIFL